MFHTSNPIIKHKAGLLCAHITPGRFTNVDDVTHDHANPRATCTIAISVFRDTSFHFATSGERRVSSARFAAQGRLLR